MVDFSFQDVKNTLQNNFIFLGTSGQIASSAVRELYMRYHHKKKPPQWETFFVMVPTHGLEPRTH